MTEDEFALITAKKLLGFVDFDTYLLRYLRKQVAEATKRLFIQGSFEEPMELFATDDDAVQLELKATLDDGFAHDGAGHLLDLGEIDREAVFENMNGAVYEVGARYIEYPREIRVNPRSGKFEYDHLVEGIGVSAAPNSMVVGASTLTFVVDSLFESSDWGDHSGRDVRVYRIVPGDSASSEAIAITTCTVFFQGGSNKITTTFLGQTVPSSSAAQYVVQLIGLMVYRDTASNRPSLLPDEVFFIGTVTGNGPDATPDTFDITGQNVIQAQSADGITVDALGDWADGTTNPGGSLQDVLEKIVFDLSTLEIGEVAVSGAGKIAAPPLPDWADGTENTSARVDQALTKIVSDLTATEGDGRGAAKLTAPALSGFPYGVPAQRLDMSLQALLAALNQESAASAAARGATALSAGATSAIAMQVSAAAGNGAGRIVIVGDAGQTAYSDDRGVTWTPVAAASGFADLFQDVIWVDALNLFVACGGDTGGNGTIQTSPTGAVWTQRYTSSGKIIGALALNKATGVLCCVQYSGAVTVTLTSTDGVAWTPHAQAIALSTDAMASNGSVFACPARGAPASATVYWSNDGVTWTASTWGSGSVLGFDRHNLAYCDDLRAGFFVAYGYSFAGSQQELHVSSDGKVWTQARTGPGGVAKLIATPVAAYALSQTATQLDWIAVNGNCVEADDFKIPENLFFSGFGEGGGAVQYGGRSWMAIATGGGGSGELVTTPLFLT